MAILNPVVSKFTLTAGSVQEVYFCPATKTHALIDLTFFKDNLTGSSNVAVALSTESNPSNLTSVDYIIDNIELIDNNNISEISKIVVGQNERLYVKLVSGSDINVRVSGIEENNSKILKAGRLAASVISNTSQTQIYSNSLTGVSYIYASVSIFNTSTNSNTIEAWITSSASPNVSDKILKVNVPPKETTILENIILTPNEKIFVQSSQVNTEYFINGVIVGT